MDNKTWRKILNEGVVIVEAVDFLNKPNDPDGIVKLTLDRKLSGLTAYYRLETDGWFRRWTNPGKGYGILLKKFKVSGRGMNNYLGKTTFVEYPVLVTYVPNEYTGEVDWDIPANYEKAKGILMINTSKTFAKGNDIEKFVNQQISKGTYQP
jgi:hypothetical protein